MAMLEAPEIETFDATAVNSARMRQPLYAAAQERSSRSARAAASAASNGW
jgi:hypothetical protein